MFARLQGVSPSHGCVGSVGPVVWVLLETGSFRLVQAELWLQMPGLTGVS